MSQVASSEPSCLFGHQTEACRFISSRTRSDHFSLTSSPLPLSLLGLAGCPLSICPGSHRVHISDCRSSSVGSWKGRLLASCSSTVAYSLVGTSAACQRIPFDFMMRVTVRGAARLYTICGRSSLVRLHRRAVTSNCPSFTLSSLVESFRTEAPLATDTLRLLSFQVPSEGRFLALRSRWYANMSAISFRTRCDHSCI